MSGLRSLVWRALCAGLAIQLAACGWEDPELIKLRQAAEQGDAEAAHTLGLLYKEDQAKGFRWLGKATDPLDGYLPAGREHLWVPPDDDLALYWFHQAADRGHPPAMYHLGTMYAAGKGTAADPFQGHVWLGRAARRLRGDAKQRALARQEQLAPLLSAYKRDESRHQARTWKPKHPK